jgi:hypothetical protein
MVSQEELSAVDLLIWQRTGALAAQLSGCNQSTVSRRLARAAEVFRIRLRRIKGEWNVWGQDGLLLMERQLHQVGRLLGHGALRLEVSPYLGPFLAASPPPGWVLGPMDHVGVGRPLQLIRERVIDAWITDSTLELPHPAMPSGELDVFPLVRFPVFLVGDRSHPLAGSGGLSAEDRRSFPSLRIPSEGFPRVAALFEAMGLGSLEVGMRRYDPSLWEGRASEGGTLLYGTPFNCHQHPALVAIDSNPLLWNTVALVCRRDLAAEARIGDLKVLLCARFAQLAASLEHLRLLR